MTAGTLTLSRPQAGVVSTFNARDYSLIDFLPIEYQWAALVQVGLTLRIVFNDGSVIELLYFYSNGLTGDAPNGDTANSEDYTGALGDTSGDLLVRTSATQLMSSKDFARTYGNTKSSGYVAVPAFEGHAGEQASGGVIVQGGPDTVPLPFPTPPPASGIEFPLPPVPPPLILSPPLLPPVTSPPNNAAVITGDTAGSVVEAGGVANAIPGVPVASGDLDAADVDGAADGWNAVGAPTPSINGYGSFVVTAAGVWTYTLNNANAAVDALAVGGTLNDAFTVTAIDGTPQTVSITITGTNDTPVVTAAVDSGVVTEGPLPVMTASGTIDFGDVDLADGHVTSVTPGGGGYLGSFAADVTNDSTGDGSGQVSWVFLATNQLRQSLQAGQQLVQSYTVEIDDGHGGTVAQLVTITINGTNNAAVITGDTVGSVVEAGGVANADPGMPVAAGDLFADDVDDPDDSWEAVVSPTASANGYGSYMMTALGEWTYTLDNTNATVQALNAGAPLIDSFVAVTVDGTEQLVTITITGANDWAEITGEASGAVTEDGDGVITFQTVSGDLDVIDVDSGENQLQPIVAGTAGANGYGTFEVLADGAWTYTLDNSDPAVQALPAGQTLQDTITVTSQDGTDTEVITITIAGANGLATITGDVIGGVTEDGDGVTTFQTVTGNLDVADEDTGENLLQPIAVGTPGANGYGTFEVLADGTWTYTLDNSDPAVQALPAGQTLQDTITVTSQDGTDTEVITITIAGTNGLATITGDTSGGVTEDGDGASTFQTVSGNLAVTDEDTGENQLQPIAAGTPGANGYGTFEVLADGTWTYTLDNSDPAVQALPAGQTLQDTIMVTSADGTDTEVITITIAGANGPATITGDVSGGVTEDGDGVTTFQTVSGSLDVTDEDSGENQLQPIAAGTAGTNGYGTFEVLADGTWTYTLDNADPAVQALPAGQTLQDTILVTSQDGTDTEVITITITGANGPAIITGDVSGAVTEDGDGATTFQTASGNLVVTDEDSGENQLQPIAAGTAGTGGYGTFEVSADGTWTYTLDNTDPAVQALPAGQTLQDTIIVTSADGTDTEVITITIAGANGLATITGDVSGGVTEDGDGASTFQTVSGNLDVADEDSGENQLQPIAAGTPGANGYGTFEVLADGTWTYTLDNSDPAVQALPAGQTLQDTITLTSQDGTDTEVITITIAGANGLATISGDTSGAVTEDGDGASTFQTVSGNLAVTDEDTGENQLQPIAAGTPGANGYGTFEVSADGAWTYTLDNALAAVQALPAGQTLQDTIVVTSTDGTDTEVITITIAGANGPATITGDVSGGVTEDGDGIITFQTVSGNLAVTDEDTGENQLQPIAAGTAGTNGYGTFEVSADGAWTYTLDNADPAVQALPAGQTLQDTITVTSQDGTDTEVITITITGANGLATITGDVSGGVTEDGDGASTFQTVSGNLDVADEDSGENQLQPIAAGTPGANGYGTFEVLADGTWTYTLDNSDPAVQALPAGQTLQDTITLTSQDGTDTQVITITITGTNGLATISGDVSGGVTEDGDDVTTFQTVSGNLVVTDEDTGENLLQPIAAGTPGTNGYGTFEVSADGAWTYTLDNTDPAVQALPAGQTLQDTITVTSQDGTDTEVITITIAGANDAPVANGDSNAGDAVVESGVNPGNTLFPGDPAAAGNVLTNDTDVDTGHVLTVAAVVGLAGNVGQAVTGTYGSVTIGADGSYSYTLDNNDLDTNALAQGATATDVFAYTVTDEFGATSTANLTITITGTNDAPVVTAAVDSGVVTEGPLPVMTATGTIDFGDVDLADAHVTSVTPGGGSYLGDFVADVTNDSTGDGSGQVSWVFLATNQLRQSLQDDQQLVQTYTVEIDDGHGGTVSQLVTITINGTNDAAVITGDTAGSVVEAGGVANADPGMPVATGDLFADDVDDPDDSWEAVTSPTASANGYGSYMMTALGEWTYTLDNTNATVQALNAGAPLIDSFVAVTVDGTEQLVTITITGANDAAEITGDLSGGVTEDGDGVSTFQTVSGDLDVIDVDSGESQLQPIAAGTAGANGYGTFEVLADGAWTYTLDNADPAVQALSTGQTLQDTITVTSQDGTDTEVITITIAGANDAPVANGDSNAGDAVVESGVNPRNTPFAGDQTATGNVLTNDTDADTNHVLTVATVAGLAGNVGQAVAGTYGSVTIGIDGSYIYTLDNSDPDTNALAQGQSVTDVIAYAVTDELGATSTANLTITITGTNDAPVANGDGNAGDPVVESGVNPGTTPFTGDPTAAGNVLTNDTDADINHVLTVAAVAGLAGNVGQPVAGTYGSVTIGADGGYTYTLDNSDPDTNALPQGATATDVFSYTVTDEFGATSTANLTITLTGTNDAAAITGDVTGGVTEDGDGVTTFQTVSGNLDVADEDTGENLLQPIAAGTAGANGYGTFEVLADGAWTYTLDNADPAVQALPAGQTLQDTILVTSQDGTGTQAITITITGINGAATITGDVSGGVTEDGDGLTTFQTVSGDLVVTDEDTGQNLVQPIVAGTPGANGYGTFEVLAAGAWTYTLNNALTAVQALGAGETVQDTITVTSQDGTDTEMITITITGTNDAAIITGDSSGAVTEAGGVDNDQTGTPTASGDLDATDVDASILPDSWNEVLLQTPSTNGYGSFVISAEGAWTYTLDNTNAAVEALHDGEVLADSFTVTTVDGTPQTVTIAIAGANDTPVARADFANLIFHVAASPRSDGTEFVGPSSVLTNDSDVDADETALLRVIQVNGVLVDQTDGIETAVVGVYGTLFIAADGNFRYVLDSSDSDTVALLAGQVVTERFDYIAANGAGPSNLDTAPLLIEIGNPGPEPPVVLNNPAPYYAFSLDSMVPNAILADLSDIISGGAQPLTYSLTFFSPTGAGAWSWLDQSAIPILSADPATIVDHLAGTYTALVFAAGEVSGVAFTLLGDDAQQFNVTVDTDLERSATNRSTGDLVILNDEIAGKVSAGGGADVIWVQPGAGSHHIDGGSGDDAIYGNAGIDRLDGGIGNDFLSGAEGNDVLDGAGGDDIIMGGEGDDELDGGGGTDVLMGGLGNDELVGAGDADTLLGDDGNDRLDGGANADQLFGGAGNDVLIGGADNDIIGGGEGIDTLEGDSGADQFVIADAGLENVDTITDYRFSQDDFIDLSGLLDANFELTSSVADFVRVVQVGRNVSLQVDVNGTAGGANWTEVAVLDNYDATDKVDVFFVGRHFILPASTITGDVTGAVVEAGGVANGAPGTPVATGDLFADDAVGPDDSWQPVLLPTPGANGYGTFTMTAAGVWTYTLDNSHRDVQALNVGSAPLIGNFTVLTAHGTPQTVAITITGANDAPLAVADDNNGDGVRRTIDLVSTGNVLLNDIDVDDGDTRTVTAVNGSAANVGQALVGTYGTMTLMADGIWTYTLDEADPETLALAPDQTAFETFSYTMSDAGGATSSTTLNIIVSGGDDLPYINTTSLHPFATPQPLDLVFINGFSFQDIDSFGDVTVTIASENAASVLQASSGAGVTVGGGGTSSITLTGTIAAINAFVSGNNVLWPSGDFVENFTLTIDDNGPLAGGMVASTSVSFVRFHPIFNDFGNVANLAGWNLNAFSINLAGGNDSVVTAWSHGPDPIDFHYDGGSGFDTVTLVFTPQQLEAILSNGIDRGVLQNYLDGDVAGPFGDNSLSLGATSWNATVTNFEDASLALATGPSGFVRFTAIGEDLPDFDATPDATDDTVVGTIGDDTISGLGGNDILVGGGGNDNLNGDAGADMLLGGSGNDTLRGAANDILAGGTGADSFVFVETAAVNSASIVDYSYVDGDTIDLSALLDAGFVTGQPVSDFVRGVQSGSSITLQVDIDGGGNSFVDVATLTGYGTNSADLVRVRFEGADHVLQV